MRKMRRRYNPEAYGEKRNKHIRIFRIIGFYTYFCNHRTLKNIEV